MTGTVNGVRRTATVIVPDEEETITAADVELYVMNTHAAYLKFYEGATDADYDAPIEDAKFERYGWAEV